MQTVAKEAPLELPSIEGLASGLRNRPWLRTPAAARPAPQSAATRIRGSLIE